MWQVLINPRAADMLETYIHWYREYCLKIFDDTGIWSEDVIREWYRQLATNLKNDVREICTERLSGDTVLGYYVKNDIFCVRIIKWRRIIDIEYAEEDQNFRYIESIRISRRR